MENKIDLPCYIVETAYKAGLYISEISIKSNYLKKAKIEKFSTIDEGLEVFLERYPDLIRDEKLKPNKLYQVRDDRDYTVFWNDFFVGFCKMEDCGQLLNYYENIYQMTFSDPSFTKDDLTYTEAHSKVLQMLWEQNGDSTFSKKCVCGKAYKFQSF